MAWFRKKKGGENQADIPTEEAKLPEKPAVADVGQGQQLPEFVPEDVRRPKSNVYTLMLILTFLIFGVCIYLTGKELNEYYDVQFGGLVESPNAPQPKPEPETRQPK